MFWRKGWLLDTLNYRIKKDFRQSIYQNEVYKQNRWSIIERQVLPWSANPIKYVFLLSLACLLCMSLLFLWFPEIKKKVPAWSQPWGDLIEWQATIFGGQLTMIGLVFPLVVGFVGILLSSKSANRALWQIYRHYSGFMFVGLSGLILAAVIILGQFVHPWLPPYGDVIFGIGVSSWLVFNVLMLGWFLYATVSFLSTDNRSSLVSRYCINEALTAELESRLSNVIPQRIIEAIGPVDGFNESHGPHIGAIMYSVEGHKPYQIKFKNNKYLHNIYFRPLKASAWIWRFRAKRVKEERPPRLILPASGKARPAKEWDLAFYSNCSLSWLEKFLIRRSYAFGSLPPIEFSSIQPVIQALAGSIDDALAEGKARLFKVAIREMEKWHADILAAAAFTNDDKKIDNWLLLGDGSFFGTSLQDELSKEYFQIGHSVLQMLPQSDQYFQSYCYLHLRIYLRNKEKLAPKIIQELMRGHYLIWPSLMNWHSSSSAASSDPALNPPFERAIRIFVGTWERWPKELPLEFDNWAQSKEVVSHFIAHLEHTAHQIISALKNNEIDAAEWATDMLVHWYENSISGREPYQYLWNQDLLVHTLLGTDTSEPLWTQILNDQQLNESDSVRISLSNAWFDVRLATAAYILNRQNDLSDPRTQKVVSALINQKRLRPSGGIQVAHHNVSTGAHILQAYIRQRWHWLSADRTYGNWMDSITESFGRSEEKEYIIGRIYSGFGAKDIQSLRSSYMAFAISLSRKEWSISNTFLEFLFSSSVSLQQREDLVRELSSWSTAPDDAIEKAKDLMCEEYTPEHLTNFTASVETLANIIETKNIQEVVYAPLDLELLTSIGKNVSAEVFIANPTALPLSLFSNINFVENLDDRHLRKSTITGFQRSQFAKNVVVDRFGDYTSFISNIISQDISLTLFNRLYQEPKFIESRFSDPIKLLERSVVDVKTLLAEKNSPVLLIGPWTLRELLQSAWWNAHEKEGDFPYSVRKDDGYPENYICHLEGVEVYQTPFSDDVNCILTTKALFEGVRFKEIEARQYVNAEFVADERDPMRGSLVLSYWMDVVFGRVSAFKYELMQTDGDD